jgi:hypothetical protein
MSLPRTILAEAIEPALEMLPAGMDTPQARVMLLAIGLQESALEHRYQVLKGGRKGPARGLWQFERGGGVVGVLTHKASRKLAQEICDHREVPAVSYEVWRALEHDDTLAAAFARLLLWTDPLPLPGVNDEAGAWDLYARVWRPGRPHPSRWPANHKQAREVVS